MTPPFQFIANSAWLDFVNTEVSEGEATRDLLQQPSDLRQWARGAKLVAEDELRAISANADDRETVLAEAVALRGALAAIAHDLAHARAPNEKAIGKVNSLIAGHPTVPSISREGGSWKLRTRPHAGDAGLILSRVVADLGCFLEEADLSLVRHCEGKDCRLFFYDTSKNHKRRWCSMEFCGNRAKVAEHRARQRTN
jgi:predicted RNA-binding Zn ribbon-like protein